MRQLRTICLRTGSRPEDHPHHDDHDDDRDDHDSDHDDQDGDHRGIFLTRMLICVGVPNWAN